MKLILSLLLLAVSGTLMAQTVATPTASPAAGTYNSTQSVSLSDTTSGALICYTTDGSTPAATTSGTCSYGTTYSNPINVSSTTTIQAIGTLAGYVNSSMLTSAYTITSSAATVVLCPNYSEVGNYAACAPSPTLAFGDQGTGTASMAIPISVNNCSTSAVTACTGSGSVTLAGSPFTISGANSGDFTVSNGTCSSGQVLVAGGYCNPTITFTPSASAGTNETATLTVQDDGATTGSQTMTLTGTSATVTQLSTSSCPTVLAAGNYQLTADISCPGMAFTYTGKVVDFNLNGYTITYGTASQTTQIGAFDAANYNITLNAHNGTISHGAGLNCYSEYAGSAYSNPAPCTTTGGSTGRSSVLGFTATYGSTISASNLTINYNYPYANAIEEDSGPMLVHDVTINSTGVGTCTNPGCRSEAQSYAIYQFNDKTAVSGSSDVYNVSQFGGPQGGIATDGNGVIIAYNYLNPGNATGTNTNDFAIEAYGPAVNVHNNLVLTPITAESGSRGILLSDAENIGLGGRAVYSNYIGGFEQPINAEYMGSPYTTVSGCQDGGAYSTQFDDNPQGTNTAYDNINVVTVNICGSSPLRVTQSEVTTNESENNTYTAVRQSGAPACVPGVWAEPETGCAYGSAFEGSTGFTSSDDTFTGDSGDVFLSANGGQGITIQSPTFNKGLNPSGFYTFVAQNGPTSNSGDQPGLIHIVDATFNTGTSPIDAYISSQVSDPDNVGPASFYIDWTQTVTVENGNTGQPISGASVAFTDALGNTYPASGPCTTDVNGQCSVVVTEYRDNNDTGTGSGNVSQAEDRNPYSLAVSASGCPTNTQTGLAISGKTGYSVTLCAAATSITAVSGSGQSAVVGTPFADPLVVLVEDANSNPLPNVAVSFSGTSVSFPSDATVMTNSSGEAEVTAEPTSSGPLTIIASTSGASPSATFTETGTSAGVLKSITLNGSGPGTTVHLKAAITSPTVIQFSSSNPSVISAPATVIVPTGATSAATGTLLGSLWTPAGSAQTAILSATLNGVPQTLAVTLYSSGLHSFACSPASCPAVVGGQPYNFTLELSGTAPVGGGTVQITSSNPAVIPNQTVAIPAGQDEPATSPVSITTNSVAATATVTVTATFNGTTISVGPITVNPVTAIKSVTSDGASSPGTTVNLTTAAPTGGLVVQISSSDQSVAYAPATVTVPAGQTSAEIGTLLGSLFGAAGTSQSATISATYNSITKSLAKTYTSPSISTFGCTITPCLTVVGGQAVSLNLALSKSAAPVGGATVTITSDTPSVIPTQMVQIAAGQTSPATLPVMVNTNTVTANTVVHVTASYNGSTKNATGGAITVTP